MRAGLGLPLLKFRPYALRYLRMENSSERNDSNPQNDSLDKRTLAITCMGGRFKVFCYATLKKIY